MDLKSLSDSELKNLYQKYETEEVQNDNLQMGLKILLNSGYGALGNKHFLYYKVENAEAITLSGQLVNRWTCDYIDKFLRNILSTDSNTWTYSDTDSGYFTVKDFVKTLPKSYTTDQIVDAVDKFCNEIISPAIDDRSLELTDYMNCYEQRMKWEREVISSRAIWVGKKKYVMEVLNNEGVSYVGDPKYKIMGMESVKSSTPEWARDLLKECYKLGLIGTEQQLQERVEQIRSDFEDYDVDTIAIPSGINGILKYYDELNLYKSGAPKHVKAALTYNKMIDDLGIKRLQKITDGDKIKYVQLKMPNPTGQETVGFLDYLPKEFGLEDYIDREAIFQKSFMAPLTIFLDAIEWTPEHVNTLF